MNKLSDKDIKEVQSTIEKFGVIQSADWFDIDYKCHRCEKDQFKLKKLENGILYTCTSCDYEHIAWFDEELDYSCDQVKLARYTDILDQLYKRFGSNCLYEELPEKIFYTLDGMKKAIENYRTDIKKLTFDMAKYKNLINAVNDLMTME